MARRSSTINKTRIREDITKLKTVLASLENEVAQLHPGHNMRHQMRLQSILGAGILCDLRTATEKLESAFRSCRSIKMEVNA